MLCRISTTLALWPAEILTVYTIMLVTRCFPWLFSDVSLVESYVILWNYARAMRYYNIRFEQIHQTRSKNCEKLGKGLFNYEFSSEARKNLLQAWKPLKIAFFSTDLFFRQSWTKVLGYFCISGAFSDSHKSNPSPHATHNVGRVYPEFFFEFQLCIGWGVGELGELGEIFEKDAPF